MVSHDICYWALIAALILYGSGMFLWGLHTGIRKATVDMKELLKRKKGENAL